MRAAGTAALSASPQRVAAVLRDPRRFVAALPNVDELEFEPSADGSFRAKIRPAIALGEVPIETLWRPCTCGSGRVKPQAQGRADDPGEVALGGQAVAYAMEGGTGEHRVALEATVELRDSDRAGAIAEWTVTFEVTGTMRSAGQRTIAAIVAAQAEQVLQAAASAA